MQERASRPPPGRIALAVVLSGSMLAMTYVLFDEDLGTAAPLFGEFTCRGALELTLTNGFGGPDLQVPESALRLRATLAGEPRPIAVRIFTREASGPWIEFHASEAPTGEGSWFLAPTTPRTEVRIDATDLEGEACDASATLRPALDAATRAPTPTPAPTAPPTPACADTIAIALTSGIGAPTLAAPQDVLRARITGASGALTVAASLSRAGGAFEEFSRLESADGDESWYLDQLDATSIARVDVTDPTGAACAASATIRAA